jgi:hypothetical protein
MFFLPRSLAQMPERPPEEYIEKIFEARIGELPRMGWFVPAHGFLAHEDTAEHVYLFASVGMPSTGRKKERISGSELKGLRKTYGLACEIEDTDHLTAFEVASEIDPTRALYTTKAMPGEAHTGLLTIPLDGPQMLKVNRLLGWPNQGTLRRDEGSASALNHSFTRFTSFTTRKPGSLVRKRSFCTARMEQSLRMSSRAISIRIRPVMAVGFQAMCIQQADSTDR